MAGADSQRRQQQRRRPTIHDRSAGNQLELGDTYGVPSLAAARKLFETMPYDVGSIRSSQTALVTDGGERQNPPRGKQKNMKSIRNRRDEEHTQPQG